ncbi:MAG: hypothetical protein ACMUIL_12660 [bacterium]
MKRGGKNHDIPKYIGRIEAKPTDEDPRKSARAFLKESAPLLKLTTDNLDEGSLSERGKFKHVEFKQQYKGIPVERARIMVNMRQNGEIISLESDYEPDLDGLDIATTPDINPQDAISIVASDLGVVEEAAYGPLLPAEECESCKGNGDITEGMPVYAEN